MITSLSRSWNTDLRTLYAYLQGSVDQFLAWHYHRLFFSPEAFYLSQVIFFCHGLGVKSNCSWGLLPCHPSCKTIGFASPRSSSHGLLVRFTLTSVRFALRLLRGSLDRAKCICFFSKLVSTCHKIPQTSLLIMYNSSFTRTFHPGKWGSLKNLMLLMVFRMVFFLMVFLLWMALLWMALQPHHLHHHHHRLQGPCHRIILLHNLMQSCHWDKIFLLFKG